MFLAENQRFEGPHREPGSLEQNIPLFVAEIRIARACSHVERVNMLANKLGEGVEELIRMYRNSSQLRTLCGIREDARNLELAGLDLDESNVRLLEAEITGQRAARLPPFCI